METVSTSSLTTPFPVGHNKTSLEIKGNKTDLVVCRYDDYFMVMVTQIGCVGTILHARKEEGFASDPTFSVSVIFGKRDEPLLVACGRQLIEHISSCGSSRPLVLTLGLKDHSPVEDSGKVIDSVELHQCLYLLNEDTSPNTRGTLKEIIAAVIENRLW